MILCFYYKILTGLFHQSCDNNNQIEAMFVIFITDR